jgi:hypothetical protein
MQARLRGSRLEPAQELMAPHTTLPTSARIAPLSSLGAAQRVAHRLPAAGQATPCTHNTAARSLPKRNQNGLVASP